ncbi:MAG: glycosyltransferase family 39 protein [Desulfovibrio sp.]|nr:glycosyltransferase family 39 protein [Desulfovibrio sp.]MBI4958014.1 glycosyltransferase family 39 protein [Desulfovibrio sp.]
MTTTANNSDTRSVINTVVLCAILAIGTGLRFYDLGVPSMWWDEILVPLISRFPATSILEWLRFVEVHPPLYYLLTKLVMNVDASDHALRLLSALPGALSIYVLYRMGKELFGSPAGLVAAGLLAVNPYAIWLSRIVRPYSLFLFLFLVSLWALGRWMQRGGGRALLCVLAANLLLFWTHYMMVVLTPAFGLAVLARSWPKLKDFWLFVVGTGASFLSILPFFLQNFGKTHWLGIASPLTILAGVGENALKLAWFFKGPLGWGLIALAIVGSWQCARRFKASFWTGMAFAVIPVAVVMAGKLAWTHEPRYFIFLLPLLLLAIGIAIQTFCGFDRPRLAVWAGLGLTVLIGLATLSHSGSLYSDKTLFGLDWIKYKVVARMIPPIVKNGEPVIVSEEGLQNALDWYLERQAGPNPLRNVRITPQDKDIIVNFLWFERLGHLAVTKEELADKFPGLVDVGTVDMLTFYKAVLPRDPVQKAVTLPWERAFSGPKDALGASHALEGLTMTPFWGGELQPSVNGVPGFVEYAVDTLAQQPVGKIEISYRYSNTGQGNMIRVMARFDDEPWVQAMESHGPDPHFYRRTFLERTAPFKRLTVRVEMTCSMITAQYPGGNLGSLTLKEVLIALGEK